MDDGMERKKLEPPGHGSARAHTHVLICSSAESG